MIFHNFLLPSDAAQIGRYMEHFLTTNMTMFMSKLNIFFQKQPAQVSQIANIFFRFSYAALRQKFNIFFFFNF